MGGSPGLHEHDALKVGTKQYGAKMTGNMYQAMQYKLAFNSLNTWRRSRKGNYVLYTNTYCPKPVRLFLSPCISYLTLWG